ncbi:MAG TPA: hypothetical protein VGM92_06345 [Candidatus Kapabacteria bacterium]|jgi:hypothetical protein
MMTMFRKEFQKVFRLKFLPLFFLLFFVLVFARSASAQLTHVDTMLAAAIMPMVPVVNGVPATMAGDSSILRLSGAMLKTTLSVTPIFYVSSLSATVARRDSGARLHIVIQGDLLEPMNAYATPRTLARTVYLPFRESDWSIVNANASHYVHSEGPSGGFWSSMLEPALVLLGCAAVVALFFLIRS